ncbi:MAG: VOC family protein [Candidatus Eremiobacteraeota bacterium]|nr:VOC family protein [Candidatus Eremiobacteraeota bacterium]MBC5802067.1 VOC family protein [Candidatus Eremiobacteraeota bacterium]MBC5822695.1 VOC family protein [Candidatus Eremiobacteraeota bacterium]
MSRPLLSHIDLRVRDRARSTAFYDALLGALGFVRRDGDEWTSYYDGANAVPGPADFEWFGFTEDPSPVPNSNRVAFVATSNDEVDRVADVLSRSGAGDLEGPNYDEGPGYYAVFFEDPDGHRLEVCCRTR